MGGDFNKKPYQDAVNDFPDLKLLQTGPTRKDEVLDLVFTNIPASNACTKPPVESEDGSLKSDHATAFVQAEAGNDHRFKWKHFKMRPKTKKGDSIFRSLIEKEDWNGVFFKPSPNEKAEALADTLDSFMRIAYPTKRKKVRNTDNPWIDNHIRGKIRTRKKTFKAEFRSRKHQQAHQRGQKVVL